MSANTVSPSDLFSAVGVGPSGVVRWGEPVPSDQPGVYMVSLHGDPEDGTGLPAAPIHDELLVRWLSRSPGLTVRGARVGPDALTSHMSRWWLPNTSVLYIGKAEDQSLDQRIGQYFMTDLGERSPHGGGYWLKTLRILNNVCVHYAETTGDPSPTDLEHLLLNTFLEIYGPTPPTHPEPWLPLPWANLEVTRPPPRKRRDHGLPGLKQQQKLEP